MSQRVYLITGATGFIGSFLLRELVAHHARIHILLRKDANVWRIKDLLNKIEVDVDDLSDAQKLSKLVGKIKPNIIYHLATYGAYPLQNNGDLCIDTNIRGTWNLLKGTANVDYELFVNTGSSSEYGFKKFPMKESDYLEPGSYYAVTKSSQTLLCSYFARENKKPIVTLRPFSVYGPYEDKNRFIPTLMKSLYLQKRMNLVSPEISRDWIYVEDMVKAYLLIKDLRKYSGEVFNIGTAKQTSIKEIIDLTTEIIGTTDFAWGKMESRTWDTSYWVADISKAKKLLKWKPEVGLREGLMRTWKWFKKNVNHYL